MKSKKIKAAALCGIIQEDFYRFMEYVVLDCMLHIWHCFPLLHCREMCWLRRGDPKGTSFSVLLQKCGGILRNITWNTWIYWPSDGLREVCITYSALSSCSILYSLSPADKSKPLRHHLLFMPNNLSRPDFLISVTALIISKHKLIFFFQSRWCLEETEFSKVSNEIPIWSNLVQREKFPL